jgi:hypothetical protein
LRKRIEYLKTDGCERIKRDYNKKSERYWDDEIYHQRSAKKNRIMEEMKNVAETYKICESSETYTSQNISCMSVAEIRSVETKQEIKTNWSIYYQEHSSNITILYVFAYQLTGI